jgi:AcrR family transcriptional regulator
MPPDRLAQLVDCATQVFIERGYRRTQMADVAEAMGVAKGTLYLYVASKEALFDLCCRHADGARPLARSADLPIPTPRNGATVAYVEERLAAQRLPALTAALGRRRVQDVSGELAGIVRELYRTTAANRRGIKLIDRSARDHPALAALWFEGARGGVVGQLTAYLDDRIRRKLLRPVPDTTVAARLVVETIVFWAVHRHWDAHPQAVDDQVAEDTVITFVVGALAKE